MIGDGAPILGNAPHVEADAGHRAAAAAPQGGDAAAARARGVEIQA